MDQFFTLLTDFLRGRSLYAPLRRLLNLVFTISLTSYLYVHYFGAYSVDDLLSLRFLAESFIRGAFIVPFSLFAIVYYVTQWTASLMFGGISYFATVLFMRWFIKQQWTQQHIRLWLRRIYRSSKYTPKPLNSQMVEQALVQVKTEMTQETLVDIRTSLQDQIKAAEASFILFFRIVVTITCYYGTLPQFGSRLYWTVLVVLVLAMFIITAGVVILTVVPEVLARFRVECDSVLQLVQRNSNQPNIPPTQPISELGEGSTRKM